MAVGSIANSQDQAMSPGKVATYQILNAKAIRDTATYDWNNGDTSSVKAIDCRFLPGRKALYVSNGTDQNVTVTLEASIDGVTNAVIIGTGVSVTAGADKYITVVDIAQLAEPLNYVTCKVVAAGSPTTGSVSVWASSRSQ